MQFSNRISIRGSVRWSVGRLVGWSVGWSVTLEFFFHDLYGTWHAFPKSEVILSLSRQIFFLYEFFKIQIY